MLGMSKQFWSGFGIAVLALAAISTYAYWGGSIVQDNEGSVAQAAVEEFTEAIRSKFVAEQGQPIEGFEPWMFMRVWPGLTAQDFNNVDALIGIYRYQNGEIVYDLNGEVELHSAARAISDEGMAELLFNIANRLNLNLEGDATVRDVLAAIEVSPGPDPAGGTCLAGSTEPCLDDPSQVAPAQ
jgi:hypothetical protein